MISCARISILEISTDHEEISWYEYRPRPNTKHIFFTTEHSLSDYRVSLHFFCMKGKSHKRATVLYIPVHKLTRSIRAVNNYSSSLSRDNPNNLFGIELVVTVDDFIEYSQYNFVFFDSWWFEVLLVFDKIINARISSLFASLYDLSKNLHMEINEVMQRVIQSIAFALSFMYSTIFKTSVLSNRSRSILTFSIQYDSFFSRS